MSNNTDLVYYAHSEELRELIHMIQKQMYGINYAVNFWVEVFDWCINLEDCLQKIQEYKDSLDSELSLEEKENRVIMKIVPIEKKIDNMIRKMNYYFKYRWDKWAWLKLSEQKEKELSELQSKYIYMLKSLLWSNTKVYEYDDS